MVEIVGKDRKRKSFELAMLRKRRRKDGKEEILRDDALGWGLRETTPLYDTCTTTTASILVVVSS